MCFPFHQDALTDAVERTDSSREVDGQLYYGAQLVILFLLALAAALVRQQVASARRSDYAACCRQPNGTRKLTARAALPPALLACSF